MDSGIIHREWANRPSDERFTSMTELHKFNLAKKASSQEKGVALDLLQVRATDDGDIALTDPKSQTSARVTHWAFAQLCSAAKAPAGYLRTLPAGLAQIPLQYSLEQQREDKKLLLRHHGNVTSPIGHWSLDALTSDSYGRIYDADVTGAVMEHIDLEVWKVPSASYASKNPRRATTLYASDRDCFVCLVDDAHPIEVPGTNGVEQLYRGVIVRNSETGACALDIMAFLYRTICDNRTIWGGQEIAQLKVRHTSGGPMRFMREAQPAIERYLTAGTSETVSMVRQASQLSVGKSEKDVQAWLKSKGFTGPEAKRAVELAGSEPGSDPRSLWGVVQGLTAQAHEIPFGDDRLDLERRASKLLDAVAA